MTQLDKDHPRACGEQYTWICELHGQAGSPPRMRGTAYYAKIDNGYIGITPAHAGNSRGYLSHCNASWDHPRACGEQNYSRYSKNRGVGSPPRMRGTASANSTAYIIPRITPAHAGNSKALLCRI